MKATEPLISSPLLARPITREEALSLRGVINGALRETRGGGRPATCECGTCAVCKRRAKRHAAQGA